MSPSPGTWESGAARKREEALDHYLELYGRLQSSIEEILSDLDGAFQQSAGYEVFVAKPAHVRNGKTAIKEARSELMRVLDAASEARHSDSFLDRPPWLDGKSGSIGFSTSEVPPLVEEYFRTASEAFVEHERLADLENEYELQCTYEERTFFGRKERRNRSRRGRGRRRNDAFWNEYNQSDPEVNL